MKSKTPVTVIFLDIDGTINDKNKHPNGYNGIKSECAYRLNRIISSTGAKLVISSAWRYLYLKASMTIQGFEYLLVTHGVDAEKRILDILPVDREDQDRGKLISEWLNRNNNASKYRYVVLDDGGTDGGKPDGEWTDIGINAAGHPVVWTDSKVGLTDADADRAIEILNGEGA
jgi:hypothetical protein